MHLHDRPISIFNPSGPKDDQYESAFRVPLPFTCGSLGCNGPAGAGLRVVRTRRLRLGASTRPWSRERDSHAWEGLRANQKEGRKRKGEASSRPWQGAQESVARGPYPASTPGSQPAADAAMQAERTSACWCEQHTALVHSSPSPQHLRPRPTLTAPGSPVPHVLAPTP